MPTIYIPVYFDGIEAETEKAYLLFIGDNKIWVPKTCVETPLTGLEDTVEIAAWFIEKNDLDMYTTI